MTTTTSQRECTCGHLETTHGVMGKRCFGIKPGTETSIRYGADRLRTGHKCECDGFREAVVAEAAK